MDDQNIKQGWEGEKIIREILKKHNHDFAQLDLVSIDKSGKIYLWEVKHQERFKAPPFDGHGLPPWQFKFRLNFAKRIGAIPMLAVVEPECGIFEKKIVLIQSLFELDKLPKTDIFITKSGKRIVFNIKAFKAVEI